MDPQRVAIKACHRRWKEKLKESCIQRVKKERNQFLWKIRSGGKPLQVSKEADGSAFGQILSDEINRLQHKSGTQNLLDGTDYDSMLWEYESLGQFFELNQEDYEELMIAMETILHEETQTEIQEREAALLEEFENCCTQEEDSLANLLEQLQTREDGLLCPICKAGFLHQTQHHIYCSCGKLHLDVQNEKVDLEFLRKRLGEILQQHDLGCKSRPVFFTDNKLSITALYMQCNTCQTFELVL